jgi:Zn-dependent protease with chaperone function
VTVTVVVLAGLAGILLAPATTALSKARWADQEPRAALVLWQAGGFAAGLAAVGAVLGIALAPLADTPPAALLAVVRRFCAGDRAGGLDPLHLLLLGLAALLLFRLVGVLMLSSWRIWWGRRRHLAMLDMVSRPLVLPWVPHPPLRTGARVLDHPDVAAYCLPGSGAKVVLTSGALAVLDSEELDAVLAHERAHLNERHDLLLLPFAAFAAALPFLPGPRQARIAVGRLVEMLADDRACSGRERVVLAAALARFGVAAAATDTRPAGALAVADSAVLARVRRLLDPPASAPWHRRLAYLAAFALLLAPMLTLALPSVS